MLRTVFVEIHSVEVALISSAVCCSACLSFDVRRLMDDLCSAGSRTMDDAPIEELLGRMLRVQDTLVHVPVGSQG